MPSVTRSAAAQGGVQPDAHRNDSAPATARRTVFAERREAAGQPSTISIDSASGVTSAPIGLGLKTPLSAVRRRSLVPPAEEAGPHAFKVPTATTDPVAPTSSSSDYLQQARASIALGHVGGAADDGTRSSFEAGAAGPPPSIAQAITSFLAAPFRSSRPSSSSPVDPILAIQPSDLRRASFLNTSAGSSSAGGKSPKPHRDPSTFGQGGPALVSLNLVGGRRARRNLRAGVLFLVAVLAMLKVFRLAPFSAPSPTSVSDRLVLSADEVAAVRDQRAKNLWAPPEKGVHVEADGPIDGHEHESTIIFLHGLAQVKNDAFMPGYLHKRFPNTRWVVPLAEKRTVSVFDREEPAWFDVASFPYDYARDRDDEGLYATARRINRLVAQERARLIRAQRHRTGAPKFASPSELDASAEDFGTREERAWGSRRIILAGFSQGAVVSLLVGLTHPVRLGGVVVFSGLLPLREDMAKLTYDLDRRDLPVWWGHGGADDVLTFPDALASLALLSPSAVPDKLNTSVPSTALALAHPRYRLNLTDVTFRWWDAVEHTFCLPELVEVDAWLRDLLPPSSKGDEPLPAIGA